MPVGYNAGDTDRTNVTIASGAQLSSIASLGSKRLAAIIMPAAWTAASLSLYTSLDGTVTNAKSVKDITGSVKTIIASANDIIELSPDFAYAFRNICLYSSVAQAEARTITLVYREV